MLSGPLRERFGMHEHLEFYDVDDLARIITINAAKLRSTIDADAAWELAARSRGTPRIANARLRWVRDYALARADGHISLSIARDALDMQEVDSEGLDKQDRRYLETLIRVFGGGPTGVEALAATMNVSVDTLEDEVEPYLLRREFVVRSPRGRQVTSAAYLHLGLPAPPPEPDDEPLRVPATALRLSRRFARIMSAHRSGVTSRSKRSRTARHAARRAASAR